jgi:adenylate cyclase
MKMWQKIGISLVVAIAAMALESLSLVEELDFKVSDQILRIKGRQTPPSGVVVVAIDEPSYKELNVSFDKPWPRALHAQMLARLKELGVKRVAFDVLFTGPSSDSAADQKLADALASVPTVIGVQSSVRYVSNQGGGYFLEDFDRPYEPFRKVAREALVGLQDKGGVIRNFPSYRTDQEKNYPFISQAAAGLQTNATAAFPTGRDLIRYYGPGRTIPVLSYWEVLQQDLPLTRDLLKDSVVIIGLLLRSDTGGAQKDSYYSPFGPPMVFGVEVHATLVANLLAKDWIARPSVVVERVAQGTLGAIGTLLALSATPVVLAFSVLGVVVVWTLVAFLLIGQGVFLAGAATVLLLLPLIVLVSALVSYVTARRAEQSLRSAFSLYVSPDMVPKLQREGGALKLGGEKMWLTAIFTDIADFTSITEDMPAERTSEMLNAYFTEVMDVVFKNQGTLLKFIGDAIFAIWGAPIKIQNHAEQALQTAIAIQREVEKFNASQRFPPLKTRIGVHTGPMLVGNLGSSKRFDYTAIGDTVNLTSRIEGINKYFGTSILFSEATRKDAGGFAGGVYFASVRVKGRKEPVRLYTVFDPPLSADTLSRWNGMFEAFSRADFVTPIKELVDLPSLDPRLTKACGLYSGYCDRYQRTPPPQGWAGEVDFDEK